MSLVLDPTTGRWRGLTPDGYARYDKAQKRVLVIPTGKGGLVIAMTTRDAVKELGKDMLRAIVKGCGEWVSLWAK